MSRGHTNHNPLIRYTLIRAICGLFQARLDGGSRLYKQGIKLAAHHIHCIATRTRILFKSGALDGGSPMSPVDFKKWQCPLSLYFLGFPVDFIIVQCRLSIVRNDNVPCHSFLNFPVDFKIV